MGKCVEGFEGVHGKMESGKEMWKEEDYWSSEVNNGCAWQTCGCERKRLILCLWEDRKYVKRASDFMGTALQAGIRRSR